MDELCVLESRTEDLDTISQPNLHFVVRSIHTSEIYWGEEVRSGGKSSKKPPEHNPIASTEESGPDS